MNTEPGWPTCKISDCTGIQVEEFALCLGHLSSSELDQYGARLYPGAGVDLRGTTITDDLLAWLYEAVHDEAGHPVLGLARFDHALFTGYGQFEGVWFVLSASFNDATFKRPLLLDGTDVGDSISFVNAKFEKRAWLGPVRAARLELDRARFAGRVEVNADAVIVSCRLTRFEEGVNLRLRRSALVASGAVFGAASSIVGTEQVEPWSPEPQGGRADDAWMPVLLSLHGTDVSNLVLADIDLRWCEFAGADRLDQLRFAGRCPFNDPPRSWRWTRRLTVAEEHMWRGWPVEHPFGLKIARIGPERLAALYRSLRKAFEDSKNEAGAGDFYYGEMEARRHSPVTPWTERSILGAYWLLSGYGQRAARAFAALLMLIFVVSLLLVTMGLPGGSVDQSVRIALGAVVFRDAGQQLTSPGLWTVMIARFLGPVLLALAVLAVRARVKR